MSCAPLILTRNTARLALIGVGVMSMIAIAGCSSHVASKSLHSRNSHIELMDHAQAEPLPGEQIASLEIDPQYPIFTDYILAPGDTLDIAFHQTRVRQETFRITLYHRLAVRFVNAPELNETQNVLPDGTISLPYLGAVQVAGYTIEALTRKLEAAYEDILRHPDIYVRIENADGRLQQVRDDMLSTPRGMSRLVLIRPDGRATFPLVGTVEVAHKTVEQLQDALAESYASVGLNVDLFLHDRASAYVYVLGEVGDPGAIQVDRPINVVQALSRAGGYTNEGQLGSTIVFRRQGGRMVAHRFDLEQEQYAGRAMDFHLRPDDVLLVPRRPISSTAQLMREISDITFFRGWGIDPFRSLFR